ncbi:hypothetical protein EV128_12532 [Rhizobium azibense]|nr:hypothetical protein EV128_12532 [Rhizobium azibense]
MPMKRFWFYHRQVDRIRAEQDLRQLHLLAGVTSQEGVKKLQERLDEALGQILVYQPVSQALDVNTSNENEPDPAFERDKLESLRASILRNGR